MNKNNGKGSVGRNKTINSRDVNNIGGHTCYSGRNIGMSLIK